MSTATELVQTNFIQSVPGTTTLPSGGFSQYISPVKSTAKLAIALAKAQTNFKPVNKSKTGKIKGTTKTGNPYEYEYQYADLSDVLGMAVPALAAEGIAFSQPIRREGDKMFVVTRIQLGDEFLEDAGMPVPTQVKPQELGTYLTYYRRYGVSTFLGIVAEEDTDGPQDENKTKPSTSGQTESSYPRTATGKKVGRPAAPISQAVAPVVPTTPAAPPIATDSDIPSNIGNKPTTEERKEFLDRLKKHIEVTGKEPMKAFLGGSTDLSKREWVEILEKLDQAASNGTLKELVKV